MKLFAFEVYDFISCDITFELWSIYELGTLQHLHSHFFSGTATHVDEQCGCSPHSLLLGCVGTSEVMHYIALFALHLEVYLYYYEAVDVSTIMLFKPDA